MVYFLRAADENLYLWAFCLNSHDPNHFAFGDVAFLKFAFLVRSDVMLCAQAFDIAFKMADVQIVLVRRFLLLQLGEKVSSYPKT